MVRASIADGWTTFKRHAGLLIGLRAVSVVLVLGASAIDSVLMTPPDAPFGWAVLEQNPAATALLEWVGFLLGLGYTPTLASWGWSTAAWLLLLMPLEYGIMLLHLRLVRGKAPGGLAPFGTPYRRYLPLIASQIAVWFVLSAMLVVLFLAAIATVWMGVAAQFALDAASARPPMVLIAFGIASAVAAFTAVVVVSVGIMYAPLLVLDRGVGGFKAVQASWAMMRGHKRRGVLLWIATSVIMLLGLLALGIGLLVASPIAGLALVAFYDRVLAANRPPESEIFEAS